MTAKSTILRTSLFAFIGCSLIATLAATNDSNPYFFDTDPLDPFAVDSPEGVDTTKPKPKVDMPYPIKDRHTDFTGNPTTNPFDLHDPPAIQQGVEYDHESGNYIINETIGEEFYRNPSYMSFDDYLEQEFSKDQQEYWETKALGNSLLNQKRSIPVLELSKKKDGGPFGNTKVDIRPQGNILLTFGGNFQTTQNPALTTRQRRTGAFNFDMNININVIGQIGDKLKLSTSYNTKATFDFENQMKLEYSGEEDEIIKKIEAGNVSLPLNSALISGSQSLFGIKTQLQFGRLTVTSVISQQKSKTEEITIEGGAQTQTFDIKADQYDENRHFFLSHYFRDRYNTALSGLPNIISNIEVTRIEVWVTNRQGATENVRDIVAFMDMGEHDPENIRNDDFVKPTGDNREPYANLLNPTLNSNTLYKTLTDNPNTRPINSVVNTLQNEYGLRPVQDFEKTFARKLNPSEFTLYPSLGFISLNQQLNPDDVLSVAYEYRIRGQVYQVGEFANDNPPDADNPDVIFTKLLKSTSYQPGLPIWDLMMKNIYSLGAYQVGQEDFRLDVLYLDPGGGRKRYIPEGAVQGRTLIQVLNLDQMNRQRDPIPDGVFDYEPGVTIIPANGRVIFPVLEPFGADLRKQFKNEKIADKYVYDILYDSTKTVALQYPQFNRYSLTGSYKSSVSSEISLGAFNLPRNSVTVTAGGQKLVEGTDYTVDYNLGRVRIINDGVLNSGVPIKVGFESNDIFGFQQKTLFGTRFDYWINDNFTLGGTYLRLSERPYTQKINIGDEPIANSIYGFDANYHTESNFITRLIDKLPLLETKEVSSITLNGEFAKIQPGHSRAINQGDNNGIAYIDDFEGSQSAYDLKFPYANWVLASTPAESKGRDGNILFPEAVWVDSLMYGFNRAKLAWYTIDPLFLRKLASTPDHIKDDDDARSNHYVREIFQQEIFPNKQSATGLTNIPTLDLAFYPQERGPYNYDTEQVNKDGSMKNPEKHWGGVMRSIESSNFEAANVEFVEFWLMDPFAYDSSNAGGDFYINLGNISEDILKDSRKTFENGLPRDGGDKNSNLTNWGKVPIIQAITNSFDNDSAARRRQDVGFDGLSTEDEADHFAKFLKEMQDKVAAGELTQAAYDALASDPSSDDYHYFRGDDYDDEEVSILGRYKKFNGPEGNSRTSEQSKKLNDQGYPTSATNFPDTEDLNRDNTLSETEGYYQYRVSIRPQDFVIGRNYITDSIQTPVKLPNDQTESVAWYQFKVPIQEFTSKSGNIQGFRSIRFVRMFLTGFEDSVIMRFARLQLVRNQWRKYQFAIQEPGEFGEANNDNGQDAFFNVASVSVEENPGYDLPPGVQREALVGQGTVGQVLQNEQSLSVQVCDLQDGAAKAVFKTINLDLRQFKRMQLFVHLQALQSSQLNDGDLTAFIRLGTDFTDNYYEYEIPLKVSLKSDKTPETIWPDENLFNILLDTFGLLKLQRNLQGFPFNQPFSVTDSLGRRVTVIGAPDLGDAKMAMIGVRNPKSTGVDSNEDGFPDDDGQPKCAELWFNEFRLTEFDENSGWAAIGRVDVKLADLGNVTLSGNMHTIGWGSLEQRLSERKKDDFYQYDAAANLQLGKFLPKKVGLQLPMYAGISESFSNPQFDPYQSDVLMKESLRAVDQIPEISVERKKEMKDSLKRAAQDYTKIKSLNFSNIRKIKTKNGGKNHFWDIENFNATYAYTNKFQSNPTIEEQDRRDHHVGLAYVYSTKANYIKPFEKLIKAKRKHLKIIRDFNFNPIPNSFSVNNDLRRTTEKIQLRRLSADELPIDPLYDKRFSWDRAYGLKYDITQSLNFDIRANTTARIDELPGAPDSDSNRAKIDSSLRTLGRPTVYNQQATANYNVPINKLPHLDWVQVRTKYGTDFNWTTSPRNPRYPLLDTIGNVIRNSQNRSINTDFNLKGFYNKFKFLRKYTKGNRPSRRGRGKTANEKKKEKIEKEIEQLYKDREQKKREIHTLKEKIKRAKERDKKDQIEESKKEIKTLKKDRKQLKKDIKKKRKEKAELDNGRTNPVSAAIIKPIISLKRISVNYSETYRTTVPGFAFTPSHEGEFFTKQQPGMDFMFGMQPDQQWMMQRAGEGWFVTDSSFQYQFNQNRDNNLTIRANIEPYPDLRIDLNYSYTLGADYKQDFLVDPVTNEYYEQAVNRTGNFTMTYVSYRTMFTKVGDDGLSPVFSQFEQNRIHISEQLAAQNGNSSGGFVVPKGSDSLAAIAEGFYEGYGPYSQDVLIPAFIAAYTGKDADVGVFNTRTFNMLPKPNWRITYNGLAKLESVKKYAKTVNLTHGYTSTIGVGTFNMDFDYRANTLGAYRLDPLSSNFFPLYNIPQLVINESLSPLIGIDITWINDLTTKMEIKKSRNLRMGLINYQLSETRTSDLTIGLGYKTRDVPIPFKIRGKKKKLENDMTFRFDFSYIDNQTTIFKLDQDVAEPTRGTKSINISPSIDYVVNDQLNVRLFFDRRQTIPATSSAFPITNTQTGIQVRFTLSN